MAVRPPGPLADSRNFDLGTVELLPEWIDQVAVEGRKTIVVNKNNNESSESCCMNWRRRVNPSTE